MSEEKSSGYSSTNLNGNFTSDILVKVNILDENNNKESIFELLKPDEIFVLYKDSSDIIYVCNKYGELFIRKLPLLDYQ